MYLVLDMGVQRSVTGLVVRITTNKVDPLKIWKFPRRMSRPAPTITPFKSSRIGTISSKGRRLYIMIIVYMCPNSTVAVTVQTLPDVRATSLLSMRSFAHITHRLRCLY